MPSPKPFAKLPDYDIQMSHSEYLKFKLHSLWLRLTESPSAHWQSTPDNFAEFRTFVRDQVLRYGPDYFAIVEPEIHPDTEALLRSGQPILYSFIHHGFFPLIAFIIAHKFAYPCTTIGTSPLRNLSPAVNPDHLYWKFAFYHQAQRWLGTRFIFSDEPPKTAIDWLKHHGSLTAAIDVIEAGVERKGRTVTINETQLSFPETVTRLARLSGRPLVASSLFFDGNTVKLRLGAPAHIPDKATEQGAFERITHDLFRAYLDFPEQRFFDLFAVFSKHTK